MISAGQPITEEIEVKDHAEFAIQAQIKVARATLVLRFQNRPNNTTQNIGTNQENSQFMAARIGGKKAATAIAIHARVIISTRITKVSSFSVAFGRYRFL